MHTIAVFNTRGGTGKSAATVFLADFLSTSFAKRVLVVDLDPQQSSSVALLGEDRLCEGFSSNASLPLLMRSAMQVTPSLDFSRYSSASHCSNRWIASEMHSLARSFLPLALWRWPKPRQALASVALAPISRATSIALLK